MRPKPLIPTRMAIPLLSPWWLPAVAEGGRPAECHKTNNACAAIAERGSARVQGGGGRHHVVHDDEVLAAQCAPRRTRRGKRARNVAESVPRCQPRLRLGMTHAHEDIRGDRKSVV